MSKIVKRIEKELRYSDKPYVYDITEFESYLYDIIHELEKYDYLHTIEQLNIDNHEHIDIQFEICRPSTKEEKIEDIKMYYDFKKKKLFSDIKHSEESIDALIDNKNVLLKRLHDLETELSNKIKCLDEVDVEQLNFERTVDKMFE